MDTRLPMSLSRRVLEDLEWSNFSTGASTGRNTPFVAKSCPYCGGVRPYNPEYGGWCSNPTEFFPARMIDHDKDCLLAKALEEEDERNP
jgi:hypothetical protein